MSTNSRSTSGLHHVTAISGPAQEKFFGVFIGALLVPQLIVALIVLFFYLLDSLYSERKDRSILFWKSLPVSDSMTVASKAIVALRWPTSTASATSTSPRAMSTRIAPLPKQPSNR